MRKRNFHHKYNESLNWSELLQLRCRMFLARFSLTTQNVILSHKKKNEICQEEIRQTRPNTS